MPCIDFSTLKASVVGIARGSRDTMWVRKHSKSNCTSYENHVQGNDNLSVKKRKLMQVPLEKSH